MRDGPVMGWDVGGAHLKVARVDSIGRVEAAFQLPCPLWQGMERLDAALDQALASVTGDGVVCHVVTMTGELVDHFPNRAEGVWSIARRMRDRLGPVEVRYFAGEGGYLGDTEVELGWRSVASANWRATAAWTARAVPEALFMDVGSTTTDLLVLRDGAVLARGRDDHERLVYDELIYTGIVRTPVAAVVTRVPFEGEWVGLMAEQFATMADVYRLTGELPDSADLLPAADGAGKSVDDSARRLARMVGRDLDSVTVTAMQQVALYVARRQRGGLCDAVQRAVSRGALDAAAPLVGTGAGAFLARAVARDAGRPYRDFADLVPRRAVRPEAVAAVSPAVAVACLLRAAP